MSFAYTMSEVQFYNRPFVVVGLALAVVLMALWGLWFVAAPLTLYETSEVARIQANGSVQAPLDDALLPSVYIGQTARFVVNVAGSNTTLTGRVSRVNTDDRSATIELANVPAEIRPALRTDLVGRVNFETRQLTPVQFVLENIGSNE